MALRNALLAIALLPALAQAQGAGPLDAYSAGGARSDVGEDAAIDAAGNVYVTGSFEGTAAFGALTLTAADDDPGADWQDVFVVKYDVEGTALWARRAGTGTFNDFAEGIAVGPDGAVYVAGYFTGVATWDGGGNPNVGLTTRNDFDAFLAKYDADGNLEWVQQAGGTGQDTGRGVAVDAANNVLFAGGFYETATFGTSTTLTSAGSDDAFLAKYDSDGDLLWVRQGGGTDGDGAWNVAADLSNNAYVVGTFRGVALWGGLPLQSRGFSDLSVVKYDPSGTAQWTQQVGANGFDYGRGIAVPPGGWGVYVTGSFENATLVGQDILTSAGASDVVLARLDPADGAPVWGVRGGGGGFDIGNDLALAPTSLGASTYSVYTTGYVDGDGTFSKGARAVSYTSHGGLDGFVAVLRDRPGGSSPLPGGAVYTLGGTNADRGWGLGTSDVGATQAGVVATGAFRDQAEIGDQAVTSAGSNDIYVGRLLFRPNGRLEAWDEGSSAPTVSAEAAAPAILSAAMPNPSRAHAAVALTLAAPAHVRAEVFDSLGRRVALLHDGVLGAGAHPLTFDGRGRPAGTYLLRVSGGGFAAHRSLALTR